MYKFFLLIAALTTLIIACARQAPLNFQGQTMGTSYMVKIIDTRGQADEALLLKQEVDAALEEVNRQMSTYIPSSEIAVFNSSNSTESMTVSPDFVKVLRLAKQIHLESAGAFDVTVGPVVDLWGFGKRGARQTPPSQGMIDEIKERIGTRHLNILNDSTISKNNPFIELDLGAIAKGHGVDVVAGILKKKGYHNFLVEIGGEVNVRGKKTNGPWKIGIDRPQFGAQPGQDLKAVLAVSDVAIATSGDYRNYFVSEDETYSHTIDPASARPIINGVASVTVVAPRCILADAMATAIMVMGAEEGMNWVESKPEVEAFIIIRNNEEFEEKYSSGFSRFLAE